MVPAQRIPLGPDQAGHTLAAVLRAHLAGRSWNQIRRLVSCRQATVNGTLCFDPARRLAEGDIVEILAQPVPKPRQPQSVVLRHLDEHIVVVEKPAGTATVRHPAERAWSEKRKALEPTLEDIVPKLIAGRGRKGTLPRLRVVHRLDKETSGLVVFARTVAAERHLGKQFHAHTVLRRYLAVVPGQPPAQTIRSHLVRDRGDGRRGSTTVARQGKEAITHVEVVERLRGYSVLACRLETGRTHQIRIHLSEHGHPVCGEKVYNRLVGAAPVPDSSGAPRLALHAAELGFEHPATGQFVHWEMPWPADLQDFVNRLRGQHTSPASPHADQVDR
jgi:23S rRNA pseudouridine1911/1915/1917 synthase